MEFNMNEDVAIYNSTVNNVAESRGLVIDLNVEPDFMGDIGIEESAEAEIVALDLNAPLDGFFDLVDNESGASDVSDNCIVAAPRLGDDFFSVEEAHNFFKLYGFQTGFGVCKKTSYKNGDAVVGCRFQCVKFRRKQEKVKDGERFPERRRPSGNSDCKVFMTVKYSELTGSWRVISLHLEHSHELTPGSSFLIPAYRYIPKRFKDMLEFNTDQGLPTADNIDLVLKMAGGYYKGTFTRKDARNHIDKYKRGKLRALGGDDAKLLADYFERKQLCDLNFWYTYKHTNDAHLWNIFWADGRGRAAYKYYHDVVVMDATYLTNRYDMALVLFVGVNHHWQTTIFACALLGRETEEDYIWCMEKFVACMNGVKPGGILTDQCPSIEKGIRYVLGSDTVHRYCAWHILHKLPEKFGGQEDKTALTYLVKATVYESRTESQFEQSWQTLMVEIGYEDAPWFKSIFRQRRKWVPVYLNDRFWAGMNTTQRVESMNSFFDNYLRSKSTLAEFVVNFESGLSRIWQREHYLDHKDKSTTPVLISDLELEKQFCRVYTNEIFYKFQDEIRNSLNLTCVFRFHLDDNTKVYEVQDIGGNIFDVQYKADLKEVFCICKKFEAFGILCSHSIMVFKHEKQLCVNNKYILDRWRKDRLRFDLIPACCPDGSSVEVNRRYDLTRKMNPIIEDFLNFGCVSDEKENEVLNGLEDLLNRLKGDVVSGSVVEDVLDGTNTNENGGSGGRASRGRGSGALRGQVRDGSTIPRKRGRGSGKGISI
ncbi:protein FAR-RED IMPAIRED RESPONSE 1-like [Carex rostrata]